MKKHSGDIIISHLHITNEDHIMFGSRDMECNRQNFLSFWTIFCLFTPPLLTFLKKIFFEKMKTKPGDISLYTCVPQMTIIQCMFSKTWDLMNRILLPSWTIFCRSLPPPPPPHTIFRPFTHKIIQTKMEVGIRLGCLIWT